MKLPEPNKPDSWDPAQYQKFQKERAQPFHDLVALLKLIPAAEITDLGCGPGDLTSELHRKLQAKSTLGLDSSSKMLAQAQAQAQHEPGLHFQLGNIEEFSEIKKYDIIFSNAALQWCPDHHGLFQRLRSGLREGGQLAVQMPMNHDYPTHQIAKAMSLESPWLELMSHESYVQDETVLKPEAYSNLLFQLGFHSQQVRLQVYPHVLESRDAVIEWVKGSLLTSFQSRLTPGEYRKFEAAFRQRVIRVLPDERPYFFTFKRILIWGQLP